MFKRANGNHKDEDEFIDIGERLAPYGDAGLDPGSPDRVIAAVIQPTHLAGVDTAPAPLHLVK
jgi:hypothetical protein